MDSLLHLNGATIIVLYNGSKIHNEQWTDWTTIKHIYNPRTRRMRVIREVEAASNDIGGLISKLTNQSSGIQQTTYKTVRTRKTFIYTQRESKTHMGQNKNLFWCDQAQFNNQMTKSHTFN